MSTINISNTYRKYFVVLALIFFSSCATYRPTETHLALSSWIDVYYTDVLFQIGWPDVVFQDGLGGRVLAYESVTKSFESTGSESYSEAFLDQAFTQVWTDNINRHVTTHHARNYELIYIDRDGYVYSFQTNRSDKVSRVDYEQQVIVGAVILVAGYLLLLLAI